MAGSAAEREQTLSLAALEGASEGALVVDQAGAITWCNRRLLEIFGYAEGALVGESIELLVPDSARAAHRAMRDGYAQHPRQRPMGGQLELAGRHADGTVVPVEISLSPLGDGPAPPVLALVTDIRARKQQEAARRDLAVREGRLETLTQTAVALAHHIRNAVSVIMMQAEAMDESDPASAAQLRHYALHHGRRIVGIVEALFELVRRGELPLTETGIGEEMMLDIEALIDRYWLEHEADQESR